MRKDATVVSSLFLAAALILPAVNSWTAEGHAPRSAPPDAVQEAQTPRDVPQNRPEQQKGNHDQSDLFSATKAEPSSTAFRNQPDEGKTLGFEFYRDPLDAKKPMTTFQEVRQKDVAEKPKVMETQRRLLESRYDLRPRLSPDVRMSRGKPVAVGPTARLGEGTSWEKLAALPPAEIRSRNLFPYPPLPHPKQVNGGQVFPQMQIDMFPRLQRFDVDFDLPEPFLPEFPPAIFLQNRPELGDVSRGEVVSINNYYRLFKNLLTPVQLDGLRMLVTPFPQEEFNPTDDRKSDRPSLGVACFDCHVNGHTTAQFHLSPDIRPQERRFRLDTVSLRGLYNQQIHASKRSLRSVEDFSEFEQRTAYFNGDEIHAAKKGMNVISRVQVAHMAQMQNMFDVPPAPKLDPAGYLASERASQAELAGQKVFFGKGRCGTCHPAPFYLDQQMHDLQLDRFTREPGDGPIKTFTLRGIKESPPYLHDGRCLTLEDTVKFFDLVLGLRLTQEEQDNLVAFLRVL
ncbi:cytochrome B6 [Geomonas nitrogeniifigens]|uniref:Cytochrome B6 n=1 Tax=Geomonas diazotrophica TaxID=2843197 RepID=A0ABX8JED7_9BACT|nr:cytochrome B6 [Geomonas nitrogeniifigens]QWV96760.1 cytochrome B6 [Geomonas nitrogeniifigens]